MKKINLLIIIISLVFASCQNQKVIDKEYFTENPPNIVLIMADDLGWGDTGYNGNAIIQTPNIDKMASEGLVFNRFYSSSPVCSPTRGSCLTGRHPYRYGVFSANVGCIPQEEILLSEKLKSRGYVTGHFGKWHLGTLSRDMKDSNRGGKDHLEHFAPPWENGFDVCFSTEAKLPTYDPMLTPVGWQGNRDREKPFGTFYWDEQGELVTQNLEGDDSEIIMDRVIPFIEKSVREEKPFFAVIWFHAPHLPVLADSLHRTLYAGYSNEEKNYFGCITAMDEQIGRLNAKLENLKTSENTMIWFTSDNGPEGKLQNQDFPGSAGKLRGRKRSLYEGGIRVPGILKWPLMVDEGRTTEIPASTLDYFPTIVEILDIEKADEMEPIDGISLWPLLIGDVNQRNKPIYFESGKQLALTTNQFKAYSSDQGENFELYDLLDDPGENTDLSSKFPDIVAEYKELLMKWQKSCQNSLAGADY